MISGPCSAGQVLPRGIDDRSSHRCLRPAQPDPGRRWLHWFIMSVLLPIRLDLRFLVVFFFNFFCAIAL
jgi:hypothetical protein